MAQRPRNRIGRPRIALIGGVVAFVVGWLAFTTWTRSERQADEARAAGESLAEIAMVDARASIEWAGLDEANALVLGAVGVLDDTDVDAVVAARIATFDEAFGVLNELADGNGSTAREAARFIAAFDDLDIDVDGENDVSTVYDVAEFARFEERPGGLDDGVEALHELSLIGAIPDLILDEAVGGDVLVSGREVDDSVAGFVDEATATVSDDGGWLGDDSSAPLTALEFLAFDRAVDDYPNQVARAESVLVANAMVTIDNWVKSLSEPVAIDQPLSLAEIADRTAQSRTELRSVFEQTRQAESAVLQAVETSALDQRQTLLALSILLALLAASGLGLAVASVVQIARRSHRRAQLATIDSLTGIGNRHQLEERTRALATDPRFAEHFVAIIDLDRFKMINDIFGHAAGDALLVEIASQLQSCGRDAEEWFPGAETTTIRLGGDEFLLSIHSPGPIDAERVRGRIESIRERTIALGDGTMRPLELSVGIASGGHLPNLSELMGAADLAVYEDKSARAHLRAANPGSHDDDAPQASAVDSSAIIVEVR